MDSQDRNIVADSWVIPLHHSETNDTEIFDGCSRLLADNIILFFYFFSESLMSYNAPRGDSELEDLSYDGYLDSGIMKGGLGQLVDGVYGSDDFLLEAREPSSG